MRGRNHGWHMPLDPSCPDNPINRFYEDPMSAECGCAEDFEADMTRRHLRTCERCQEFGAANIEAATP